MKPIQNVSTVNVVTAYPPVPGLSGPHFKKSKFFKKPKNLKNRFFLGFYQLWPVLTVNNSDTPFANTTALSRRKGE